MRFLILFIVISTFLFAADDVRKIKLRKISNEQRVALVIGNANYEYFSKLKNPINDAKDIENLLKQKGFDVAALYDASQKEMEEEIEAFYEKIQKGGVGLFYYAGHGLEVNGFNYLIPVNANITNKKHVKYKAVATNLLIDYMESANNRLNIVILDACRNDPFSRGTQGGLAPINTAKGIYVAYSTAPGKVASDGDGKNGLFTKYLLKHINQRGVELDSVFRKVRRDVQIATNSTQIPWSSSSVIGEFYFSLPSKFQPLATNSISSPSFENKSRTIESNPLNTTNILLFTTLLIISIIIAYFVNNFFYKRFIRKNSSRYSNKRLKFKDHIEPEMLKIEAGEFMMGKNGLENARMHFVEIKNSFYLSTNLVTFEEYDMFCKDTNREYPSDEGWGRGKRPVINVSWHDVKAYIKWLNSKSHKNFRLPSEAEWEYSISKENATFGFGSDENKLTKYAWFIENSNQQTQLIATKKPIKSLYDMHGNVWEWCEDWYTYYSQTPKDGSANENGEKKFKIFRGGSWNSSAFSLHSATRSKDYPTFKSYYIGFRLAAD